LAISLMVDAYALLNKKLNNPKKITDSMFATVVNMAAVEVSMSLDCPRVLLLVKEAKEFIH
jgi:hypothetical protein